MKGNKFVVSRFATLTWSGGKGMLVSSFTARYLELVRESPPERNPERFAAVRAAYERLKDLDARVRHRLFEQGKRDGIDELIEEMACRTPRRRYGLQALLQMHQRAR